MAKNKGQENLIPLAERTEEERKAIASKGGKAKAEKEKHRKIVAETFKRILELEIDEPTYLEIFKDYHTGYKLTLNLEGQTLLTKLCAEIVSDAIGSVPEREYKARQILLRYIEPLE